MSRMTTLVSFAAVPVLIAGATLVAPAGAAGGQTAKLSLSDDVTTDGDYVTATAAFTPARYLRFVYLQQLQGDTWVTIGTAQQSRTGRAKFTVPTVYGSKQYRAVTPAKDELPTRKTATKKLRAKATGTVVTSYSSSSEPALGHDMSSDGRFIVQVVDDLDEGDIGPEGTLWDSKTGVRTVLPFGDRQGQVRISGDGSTVVGHVGGAFVRDTQWFVRAWDRASNTYTDSPGVHYPTDGTPAPDDYLIDSDATVSDGGRYVAFRRQSVTNKRITREGVVRWDRITGKVEEITATAVDRSLDPASGVAAPLYSARISGDGAWVAVNRIGTPGAPAQLWSAADGSLKDLQVGANFVTDLTADASYLAVGSGFNATGGLLERATGIIKPIRLSGAYRSWSTTSITSLTTTGKWLLVTGESKGRASVFLVGRQTGRTIRASLSWKGKALNKSAGYGIASDDARFVAFRSRATNVNPVPDTLPLSYDIFQRDRG